MSSGSGRRTFAGILLIVTASTGIAVGCFDEPGSPSVDAVTGVTSISDSRLARPQVTAAEFHAGNRMDWVGQAHNAGIDSFRVELRMRERQPAGQICSRVHDFVTRQRVVANHLGSEGKAAAAERALRKLPRCADMMVVRPAFFEPTERPTSSFIRASAPSARFFDEQADVEALVAAITAAVDASSSANDLASTLSYILSDTIGLSQYGQDAVLGAASLALSSAEYWQTNAAPFAEETLEEYPCVIEHNCAVESIVPVPRGWWSDWLAGLWSATKVVGAADAVAGGSRVITTWFLGPVAWTEAAAEALSVSIVTAVVYIVLYY